MTKVNFGIIGCGAIAAKHGEAIKNSDLVNLDACFDTNFSRAGDFADLYGGKAFSDLDLFLSLSDIDVVSICVPSGLHASLGIACAKAGKHVLVEKPMALSLQEADELIQACEENGVLLGVVHQNRTKPAIKMLRKAIEEARFGKLTHASAVIRWNRDDGYFAKESWRGTKKMDGGLLINQAIHNIDLLQWMMGDVEKVYALTGTFLRKIETEDVAVAALKFKNGALGTIEGASTIYPRNLEESLSIFGEKGSVIIEGVSASLPRVWKFENISPEEKQALSSLINEINVSPYQGHLEVINDMAEAVKTGRQPIVNGYDGRKAIELILAIYDSADTGLPVELSCS